MKYSWILNFGIALMCVLITGCNTTDSWEKDAYKALESLQDNQARIIINIGGKAFYPDSSVFTGQMTLTKEMLSLALGDQFEGKSMLNLGGTNLFSIQHLSKEIVKNDPFTAGFRLGKLVDPKNMIGEGYMMTEGTIDAVKFEKEQVIFRISGKVSTYSDFQQPDKFLSAEGIIAYKKPTIIYAGITEGEVFDANAKAQ